MDYQPSAPAIEPYSSKAIAGKEFSLLHHYIFIISQLSLNSHQRSTVVLLDAGTPGTSREIYNEVAAGETRTRKPWITNPLLFPFDVYSPKLLLERSWVHSVGVLHHYIFIISQL